MNINEKINARSWYSGALLNFEQRGRGCVTPTRLRIYAPYYYKDLRTTEPRCKGEFYFIVGPGPNFNFLRIIKKLYEQR